MLNKYRNSIKQKSLRKKLREESTEAEKVLWYQLRHRRFENLKFYRQYGVGNYILDFYCPQLKLAIELDGGHHAQEQQAELDQSRQEFLNSCGIRVIRFWNNEVTHHLDNVLEEVFRCIKRPLTPS